MERISIRNAKFAKIGLQDMIDYMNQFCDTKELVMAEIGCYVGDSTEIFAKNFKKVFAIDPWKNGYDDGDPASYQHDMKIIEAQFDEMFLKYDNISKIKMKSLEACEHFKGVPLDFVYIDGLHTFAGVVEDILNWTPQIRGLFIGGHDYQAKFQGTIDAVNSFGEPEKIFKDTSWVLRI